MGQSITQTSALINPVGGLGPSVTSLRMTSPTSNSDPLQITSDLVHEASFEALTSATAAGVNWSVGGEPMGKASAPASSGTSPGSSTGRTAISPTTTARTSSRRTHTTRATAPVPLER